MSFYDTFLQLCKIRDVSPSAAAIASGLSKSAPSKWKAVPETVPSGETMKKLADYFGVSVGFLSGTEPYTFDLSAFPEISMIARAGTKMPKEKRSELLNYAKYLYPEAFDD